MIDILKALITLEGLCIKPRKMGGVLLMRFLSDDAVLELKRGIGKDVYFSDYEPLDSYHRAVGPNVPKSRVFIEPRDK